MIVVIERFSQVGVEGLATRLLDLDLEVQSDSKGIGRPGRRGRLDSSISEVRGRDQLPYCSSSDEDGNGGAVADIHLTAGALTSSPCERPRSRVSF